jgi:hypothetical protein
VDGFQPFKFHKKLNVVYLPEFSVRPGQKRDGDPSTTREKPAAAMWPDAGEEEHRMHGSATELREESEAILTEGPFKGPDPSNIFET